MGNQERGHMPIKCAAVYQDRIWISSHLYNALYCYDHADNNMEYLGEFKNQDTRDNLHRQIIRCGDVLFFIPLCAQGIDVYNIKEQRFENTVKSSHDEKLSNRIAFQISDEMVWLFPQNIKEPLYVLYTKEKRMELLFEWEKAIDQIFPNKDTYLVSASGICTDGKSVYAAIYNKGIILEINRETLKIRKIFSDEKYRFASINYFEESLYLTEIGNTGVIQIEKDKAINKIENRQSQDVLLPYSGMVQTENGFLMIPYLLNDFYFLNPKENIVQNADIHFRKIDSSEPCFFNWQIYEGNIFLYPARAKSILTINCQNFAVQEIDLKIPEKITEKWILKNKFIACRGFENNVLHETDFYLEEFIMLVEKESGLAVNNRAPIGKEIYTLVNRERI